MKHIMKQGFTFVEIIIVVAVMSVLSFITYKQFEMATIKSRDGQRKSDLHEVSKSIQMYFADYGHVPNSSIPGDPDINKLWGKTFVDKDYTYLKQVPEEKYQNDKPYCYLPGDTGDYFGLYAELQNKDDPECTQGKYSCGGRQYCYGSIVHPEKPKIAK
jgi:prepilin-type N-terminal cleavage/methylation domain-containing protein